MSIARVNRTMRVARTAPLQAVAPVVTPPRRLTCEGCIGLAQDSRPRCLKEDSEHFRRPREAYQERCAQFSHSRTPPPGDA